MKLIAAMLSFAGLLITGLFLFRPVGSVSAPPTAAAVAIPRENILELARETDMVEQRFADAATECNRHVDPEEVVAAVEDTAAVLKLRGTRIAQRVTTTNALSFDVSVRGDFQKLMRLLDEVSQWRKLALVKDLRIQRTTDDELNASFVLVVFSNPARFATAVINRAN